MVVLQVQRRRRAQPTGVVEGAVQAAEVAHGRVYRGGDIGFAQHVGTVKQGAAAGGFDIARHERGLFGVACGQSLAAWESSGWIAARDPYGWHQWYCRFYQGRRTDDDERQIGRWLACAGPTGRWKGNLAAKVVAATAAPLKTPPPGASAETT